MIAAAACQFPAATYLENRPVHTRHNAAIGLSELIPDAIVIVVSEESGNVSITTRQGHLEVMESPKHFRNVLCRRLGLREDRKRPNEPDKSNKTTRFLEKFLDSVSESGQDSPQNKDSGAED